MCSSVAFLLSPCVVESARRQVYHWVSAQPCLSQILCFLPTIPFRSSHVLCYRGNVLFFFPRTRSPNLAVLRRPAPAQRGPRTPTTRLSPSLFSPGFISFCPLSRSPGRCCDDHPRTQRPRSISVPRCPQACPYARLSRRAMRSARTRASVAHSDSSRTRPDRSHMRAFSQYTRGMFLH